MNQQYSLFPTPNDSWDEDNADCGNRILKYMFESMMIDNAWSIREERGYQWWGQHFAQRVWAEPPRKELGDQMILVHVETDFLRSVPDTSKTYLELNKLQSLSSLYAFVYFPTEKKISLHSTAYVYEGNYGWLSRMLVAVAGLQLADAYGYPALHKVFDGSEWDSTPHPANGLRRAQIGLLQTYAHYTNLPG